MINQTNEMATLAGWLEEKCGQIQAQYVLDEITRIQNKNSPLECMEIMLLADLIHGYRKEMLRQIKEFKALRKQEVERDPASFSAYRELRDMEQIIRNGIQAWQGLRDDYFLQRACYMEHCGRSQNGFAVEGVSSSSVSSRRRA